MGKLLQFPTGKEITQDEHGNHDTLVDTITQESVEISQHLIQMVAAEIEYMQYGWLEGFDINDEQYPEARDAYVIANLIYAMLLRYIEIPHKLHKDMDKAYIKLKKMQAEHAKDKPDNDTT